MSPAVAVKPVTVQVVAADAGTRILIFDASFQPVGTGVGRLTLPLDGGIYKARFEAGDRLADVLFEVGDAPITVNGPALYFSSPIPLSNTSTNHEYQYYPSRDLASKPPLAAPGNGGQVFVFARDSRQEHNKPPPGAPQWQGLRIRNAKHESVFDIDPNGILAPESGFASVKLELDPGLYFLEQPDCAHPDMVLKLPFVVCEGWCTHVYIDSKNSCKPDSPTTPVHEVFRVFDLAGAAMVMLRVNASTQLDEDVARLSEIARQGLMHSQEAVSEQELEEMLDGKREFPMLGLYAAHVLLARPEKNWEKVARIAQHLQRWLGNGHPDVNVLLGLCARHGIALNAPPSSVWPPLLATSWDLAVANDIEPDNLEGRGDWQRQYRIGGSMWSCLYAPKRLAELSASRAVRTTSFRAPPVFKASDIVHAAGAVLAAIPHGTVMEAAAEALDWKHKLIVALQRPDPESPPFEQAVRRRVLDLLGDADEPVTFKDIRTHVASLAAQFRVPAEDAGDVLAFLLQRIRD
jgi:hypothetical protein